MSNVLSSMSNKLTDRVRLDTSSLRDGDTPVTASSIRYRTCKCSTFAVSSVRSRRARPPHVGKDSDTRTEPCQERNRRWEQNESRPARLPEAGPNSAKEALECRKMAREPVFALDAF